MNGKILKLFVCVTVLFIVGVMGFSAAYAKSVEGEYYTKANIWYEDPEKILSTNFHRGAMISVGTKVIIDSCKGKKIKFTEVDEDLQYTYIHSKKHSNIALQGLFDRYFSKEDPMLPGGPFSKFTANEKRNIKDGTIAVGMSKDATLMAYGYPPTHRTPSLKYNVWTYWRGRAGRMLVVFSNGKIKEIQK